jgi:hypothetical protein
MILVQEPNSLYSYYVLSPQDSQDLNKNKIFPLYFWRGMFYYKKTDKLKKYLNEEGGEKN